MLSSPASLLVADLTAAPALAPAIHTSYLWHMHQPIHWPERSTWNGSSYEHALETILLGHSQSDLSSVLDSDDRVRDYQDYRGVRMSASTSGGVAVRRIVIVT